MGAKGRGVWEYNKHSNHAYRKSRRHNTLRLPTQAAELYSTVLDGPSNSPFEGYRNPSLCPPLNPVHLSPQ